MAYFDEFFCDTDSYFQKLYERMLKEMEEIEKEIRSARAHYGHDNCKSKK